jgi:acetoin utilization deacetylase AcuC-like enzyme
MVKDSVMKNEEEELDKSLEDDYTCVSSRSLEAAKAAVRSALNAVDTVMEDENIRNAFVAVRPPGHHIGPDGMTNTQMEYDRNENLGNCVFNNVAIAGVYAMLKYREKIKKIAIMDFDIHHGNGTEKFVQERSRNTNDLDEQWLYASVHGHDGHGIMFYPGSGLNKDTDSVVNVELGVRKAYKPASSRELRGKFRKHVTKGLNGFKPDLIIISAGFDGHENCFVRATNFKDEDYTWMTEEIMTIANRHCEGRIVSVLEGGYNTRAGYFSPLAQSVLAHVNALKNYSSDIVVFKPLERELSEPY